MRDRIRIKRIFDHLVFILMPIWIMVPIDIVTAQNHSQSGGNANILIKDASVVMEGGLQQTDLFVSGRDGYKAYRIPALVVSNRGTILAICEARKNSFSDKGDIDLVIKRSFDNGQTWTRMKIIRDDGDNTVGNPCPVVDRQTGTIWLPFCRNNKRVFITKSTDNGATWSAPVEITGAVSQPEWA